jgi:hypothetical protein
MGPNFEAAAKRRALRRLYKLRKINFIKWLRRRRT